MSKDITVNGRRVIPVACSGKNNCDGCVFDGDSWACSDAVNMHNCKTGNCVFHDAPAEQAPTGGKQSASSYYHVAIGQPMQAGASPYVAECADIIEALDMTFSEGEAFKALWRLAAARQGRGKPGNALQYDADKVAHYGARVAAHTRRRNADAG